MMKMPNASQWNKATKWSITRPGWEGAGWQANVMTYALRFDDQGVAHTPVNDKGRISYRAGVTDEVFQGAIGGPDGARVKGMNVTRIETEKQPAKAAAKKGK